MKNVFYISVFFVISSCHAQSSFDYYKVAYEYLESTENKSICLSDTIIYIGLTLFTEEISNGQDFKKVLFELDSIDNHRNFVRYKYPKLNEISSNSDADLKLYFSEIYKDNMLFAELIPSYGRNDLSYDCLVSFNLTRKYLFVFNENKQIIKVYTITIQYD